METNTNTETAPATAKPRMMDVIRSRQAARGRNWEPTEQPWRLSVCVPSEWSNYTHHVATFETKEAALAALETTMPKGAFYATVSLAINPEDWIDRGRWQNVARRKPTKKTVMA